MPILGVKITTGNYLGAFRQTMMLAQRRIEYAALKATDQAATQAKSRIREAMQSAGLGRLGNAIASTSDLKKGQIKRYSGGGFRASGVIYIRSGSARTRGAIESYTVGADIRPVRSRWLWIATDQIPRVTGRKRMTPELYVKNGFEQKIGPLVYVKSVNGNPLLVVKSASVALSGRTRSAKSRTKTGLLKKGQGAKEFIVAFIGIPRTSRAARVDVSAVMRSVQAELPALFNQAMGAR